MQEELNQLRKEFDELKSEYHRDNFSNLWVFKKIVSFKNKIGFFGVIPVSQQSAITTPSGGGGTSSDAVDITARTAIGQIKTALQNLGLTA